MDEIAKIKSALNRTNLGGKVTALQEGGKVLLMIQDAPDELRRIADEMEKIGVREIKAFVAYAKPGQEKISLSQDKDSTKNETTIVDKGQAETQEDQ